MNVTKLRQELTEVFYGIKDGSIPVKKGKEVNNSAARIMETAKVELEYKKFHDNKSKIDFLETTED